MKTKASFKRILVIMLTMVITVSVFSDTMPSYAKVISRYVGMIENLKVGYFAYPGYHDIDENGNYSGYGYDCINMIAGYMNHTVEFVGYDSTFSKQLSMLENGELDILTYVEKTPERSEKMLFSSEPIGTSKYIITKKTGNKNVTAGNYSTYNGKRVGMLEGSIRNSEFSKFASQKGFTYKAVIYDSQSKIIDALQNGDIDLAIGDDIRLLENETVLESFGEKDFYVVTSLSRTGLMTKIDAAITMMNSAESNWRSVLYNRYFGVVNDKFSMNKSEKAFFTNLKNQEVKIKVVSSPDRKPYSYLENGEMKGIVPDLFREMAECISLDYEFLLPKDRSEYIEMVKSNEAEIVLDFLGDYNEASAMKYKLTETYIQTGYTIVTTKNMNHANIRKIAIPIDYVDFSDVVKAEYPNAEIVYYYSIDDCLSVVKSHDADGAVLLSYSTQVLMASDIGYGYDFSFFHNATADFRMAVPYRAGYYLRTVGDKLINKYQSDGTINEIIESNTRMVDYERGLKYLMLYHPWTAYSMFGLLFIMIVLVIITVSIKRRNALLSKELLLEKISYHDHLTGFKNHRAFYKDVENLEKEAEKRNISVGIIFADVNGLKRVNDKYGHEAGDKLLQDAAAIMSKTLTGADFYRFGGDEFVAMVYDLSEDEFNTLVARLKNSWTEEVSAAVGGVWLPTPDNIDENVILADKRMYQDKNRHYHKVRVEGMNVISRFREEDIYSLAGVLADSMPGGFLAYRADGSEEILFYNKCVPTLFECDSEEEFEEISGNKFSGMVCPEDYARVTAEIKSRIPGVRCIDCLEYRIVTRNGSMRNVKTTIRLVHTQQYDDVFYVSIIPDDYK